jgi:hypothetical protein
MEDLSRVQVVEPLADLDRNAQRLARGHRAVLHEAREATAVDVLHHEVRLLGPDAVLVDLRDARVGEAAEHARLALEPEPVNLVGAELALDDLDDDLALERPLHGKVDLAAAAGSDRVGDRVGSAELLVGLLHQELVLRRIVHAPEL